jgi:hypothetical protein
MVDFWIALGTALFFLVVLVTTVTHERATKGDRLFFSIMFGMAIIYISMHAGASIAVVALR